MNQNAFEKSRHPIVVNSFYLYLSHFADFILSILILPFIARILGPAELGYVALAQTFGLFLLLIMEFGFSLTATREIAVIKNNKEKLTNYISNAFSFKLLLIPFVVILSTIVIVTFPLFQSRPFYIIIVMIGSIFQGLSPTWFFQGIERLEHVAKSKIIFRIIGFLIVFIFVKNIQDGWIVLLAYTFTSILIFFYLTASMVKINGKITLNKNYAFKTLWIKSKWVFFLTLIPVFFQNGMAFFLGNTVSPVKLGLFFGAAKIHRAFNTFYGPLGQAFYPRLVAYNELSEKQSNKLLSKFFWILLTVGLLFSFIIMFFSDFLIIALLGNDFLGASLTLKFFGITLPLIAISHVIGRQWMLVKGCEKSYAIIVFIASVFSFLFIVISVKTLNIIAVPVAMIIFELITILLIIQKKIKPNE